MMVMRREQKNGFVFNIYKVSRGFHRNLFSKHKYNSGDSLTKPSLQNCFIWVSQQICKSFRFSFEYVNKHESKFIYPNNWNGILFIVYSISVFFVFFPFVSRRKKLNCLLDFTCKLNFLNADREIHWETKLNLIFF